MVHCRRVPAGRTVSRALALAVKTVKLRMVKVRRDTARIEYELDFMTAPRSHALEFFLLISKQLALSPPRLMELNIT
jgi:hypothetical protein